MHFPFPSHATIATRILPAFRYITAILLIIQLSLLTASLVEGRENIRSIAFSTLSTCLATLQTWYYRLSSEKTFKSDCQEELELNKEREGVEEKVRVHMEQWKLKEEERLLVEGEELEKEVDKLRKELEGIV